jgi:hypothetical protein
MGGGEEDEKKREVGCRMRNMREIRREEEEGEIREGDVRGSVEY